MAHIDQRPFPIRSHDRAQQLQALHCSMGSGIMRAVERFQILRTSSGSTIDSSPSIVTSQSPLFSDKEHATELHQLLQGSSSLAARAESLHVCGYYAGIIGADTDSAQISSHFGSLTRLKITVKGGIRWASIPVPFRNSIHGTLARTAFTWLELNYVYDLPFNILAACSALRSVTLRGVSFDKRDTSDSVITTSPPVRLEHFDLPLSTPRLRLFARWIPLPQSPVDISCLRSLACAGAGIRIQRPLNASAPSLQRFLLNCGQTLKYLDLHKLIHLQTPDVMSWDVQIMFSVLGNFTLSPQQAPAFVLHMCRDGRILHAGELAAADHALP
ncbi:hypothetical protein B0H14DRAFT_3454180 [Mycena olivaceomarginata]|nr:hypothetical protein B0H14DRAFT_3454180 [Mycena olivaceomarginata]